MPSACSCFASQSTALSARLAFPAFPRYWLAANASCEHHEAPAVLLVLVRLRGHSERGRPRRVAWGFLELQLARGVDCEVALPQPWSEW